MINRKNTFPISLPSENLTCRWGKGDGRGSFTIANESYNALRTLLSQKIGRNGGVAKLALIKTLHAKRMKLELGTVAHSRSTNYSVG